MATLDEVIASAAPKQRVHVETLVAELTKAEAAKDEPTPVADAVKATDRFLSSLDVASLADVMKKMTGGAKAADAFTVNMLAEVSLFADALRDKMETADWAVGNEAASKVNHAILGDSFEDDAVDLLNELTERWALATKAKGASKGVGTTNWPDLPTTVFAHCKICGATHRTGKANPNSLRHYGVVHLRDHHKIELSKKYGADAAGRAEYGKMTAAVAEVFRTLQPQETDHYVINTTESYVVKAA